MFNWIVDGLPAAELFLDGTTGEYFYNTGVPLGFADQGRQYLNNHYSFHIKYFPRDENHIRVVGILVLTYSLSPKTQERGCVSTGQRDFFIDNQTKIKYTYNVFWEEEKISWGTRWDHYLHVYDPQIHWFR
jgi:transmembrane 9 superfamily protein 2/4